MAKTVEKRRPTAGAEDVRLFATRRRFEAWLDENHATSRGIWLKLARKNSGVQSVSRPEALEAALCFGWIDGQARSADGEYWLQRFTPRRPRSRWFVINCRKADDLIAQGRMRPAGLAEVAAAKRDGRWAGAYASPREITVPHDFQQRLDRHPRARAAFERLDSRNRYAMLYRLHHAKRPETRIRRIEQYVAMLKEGKTIS